MLMFTYTDQDALALEVDITDGELVGERHVDCGVSTIVIAGLADVLYTLNLLHSQAKT